MDCVWDIIVVGAGVVGSATAYQSAKAGYRTLLLEQFPLPHTRGSSHGQSRVIRKAYNEVYYAEMMKEAYRHWETLEKESGINIYTKTGLLSVDEKDSQELVNTENALCNVGGEFQKLSHGQLASKYPMLTFPSNFIGIFDPDGGVLAPDKALVAFRQEFLKLGGKIYDGDAVTRVTPGDIVEVTTRDKTYQGRNIILTAGSWTQKLCSSLNLNLPLKVLRTGVYYWNEKQKVDYSVSRHCPVVFWFPYKNWSQGVYTIPSREYPNAVKVGPHDGLEIDPDARDLMCQENDVHIERVKGFIRRHLTWLNDQPSIVESCIYTMTPDQDFILDTHPKWKNIVIGAGFSGHGFKFAPVLGKLLFELATGRHPTYDLSGFKISRFATSKL